VVGVEGRYGVLDGWSGACGDRPAVCDLSLIAFRSRRLLLRQSRFMYSIEAIERNVNYESSLYLQRPQSRCAWTCEKRRKRR
jgi:hypothetical protein